MTNLFRNSSPGALTLKQSVELQRKRLIERGLQMRQARALAAKGRGGDTEIAHVTPGEIVLPKAFQTAAVLGAIREAAAEANIPLDRLRIGSPTNSINPETGMPEFSYGGPEDESDVINRPAEQQVADVFINRFPDEAMRQGHVGIGVNTDQTDGFYPVQSQIGLIADESVPGIVKKDDMSRSHDTLRIPTTSEQDAAIQTYIDNRRKNPGDYNLYNRQCTDMVSGALRAGNVEIPSSITDTRVNEMSPNRFFPLLRNRYGR